MTDTKFTREALTEHITALDKTIALVTVMLTEALDPVAPRKDVLDAATPLHASLVATRKQLSVAFAAVGVRPV
jgi:hypothetical protein